MAENIISLITNPLVETPLMLFLVALNAVFIILFFLMRRRLNRFLKGKSGKSMEDIINKSSTEISQLADDMENTSRELKKQGEMIIATIKKIGIVRFNPFNNTGGDQSFAIAMLNSRNSGIVISSLYLREGTRVYAKPIEKLKSTYPLSQEEQEAIKKAIA